MHSSTYNDNDNPSDSPDYPLLMVMNKLVPNFRWFDTGLRYFELHLLYTAWFQGNYCREYEEVYNA